MNLTLAKMLDRRLGGLVGRGIGALDRVADGLRRTPGRPDVRHILVTKFWGLGNWALLRPVVRDLSRRWPAARITVATFACNLPLVRDLADDLLLVRPTSLGGTVTDLGRAVARLRASPPDLALDFEPFARSGALLARLGGAGQRLGFHAAGGGRDGLYTVLVPLRREAHISRSFRDLAEAAGVAPGPYVAGALEKDAKGDAEVAALEMSQGRYVVVHPGSGDNFPGRRWSPAGFAAVGRAAVQHGLEVCVTGSRAESPLVGEVCRGIGSGALALPGRLSLRGLIALLDGAAALISNDTGPVHLASALDVPTLALYGPNTPVLYGPLARHSRAFYRALPCSPCLTAASYRSSRCRIHVCMESITTGVVTTALHRLLEARVAEDVGGRS